MTGPPDQATPARPAAFASALSVPELAACLDAGLEPVGLVQGFCVMQWAWYGMGSPYQQVAPGGGGAGVYSATWRCPHGFVSAEHRSWGSNYEQPWVEQAWSEGFGSAYRRMVDEAVALGAHGVIGVVDRAQPLSDLGVSEFHLLGTAVRVAGVPDPAPGTVPFTTYLAGPRLSKLLEAGYVPVSVAAALASVRVWASCITEMLLEGGTGWGVAASREVDQVSEAATVVRQLAREHVRAQLGGDSLHGARLEVHGQSVAAGDEVVECTLRGTRVRRFEDASPLAPPRPTVHLW